MTHPARKLQARTAEAPAVHDSAGHHHAPPPIALFGAAGAIGQSIAAAIRAKGQPYRVVGRSRGSLSQACGADPLADIMTWNPDDPASVQAAASGVETLVYMVGVNYWQFELHPQVMRKTLAGAIAAGVRNIVLIGKVYPYGRPRTQPVREAPPGRRTRSRAGCARHRKTW